MKKDMINGLKMTLSSKFLLFMVLGILVLAMAGCVMEYEKRPNPDSSRSIIFSPIVEKNGSITRAAAGHPLSETATLIPENSSFAVYAYESANGLGTDIALYPSLNNQNVKREGLEFIYTPVAKWPVSSASKLSFFGYYPYTAQTGSPNPAVTMNSSSQQMTIVYTVPSAPQEHIDLMYASTALMGVTEPVTMNFKHALTWVRFNAKLEDPDEVINITKITLKNAVTKGTLTVLNTASTWSLSNQAADKANYVVTSANGLLSTTNLTTTSQSIVNTTGQMLVLPQSVTNLVVEVEATKGGVAYPQPLTFSLTGTADWEMNKIVTYDITIAGTGTSITAIVEDWNTDNNYTITNEKDYLTLSKKVVPMGPFFGSKNYVDYQTSFEANELMLQQCDEDGNFYDEYGDLYGGGPVSGRGGDSLVIVIEGMERYKIAFGYMAEHGDYITVKSMLNGRDGESFPAYFAIVTGKDDFQREYFKVPITVYQEPMAYENVGRVNIYGRGSYGNPTYNNGDSQGIYDILTNSSNFGPNGTVQAKSLGLIYDGYSTSTFTFDDYHKDSIDLVDLAYYSNLRTGDGFSTEDKAELIIDWFLESGKNYRFLRISPENGGSYDISQNFLPIFWDRTVDWDDWDVNKHGATKIGSGAAWINSMLRNPAGGTTSYWRISMVTHAEGTDVNKYITGEESPFGAVGDVSGLRPVDSTFGLMTPNLDGTYGPPGYNFIPLAIAEYTRDSSIPGKYLYVGIDLQRRVLYFADGSSCQYKTSGTDFRIYRTGSSDSGNSGKAEAELGLGGTTYAVNRLYANMYGYVVNWVTAHKDYKTDENYNETEIRD